MTSHGFGKALVESKGTTLDHVAKIARDVSLVRGIIKAHISSNENEHTILFEFEHLDSIPGYTLANLVTALKKIDIGGHGIPDPICWVVQSSYQQGKKLEEHGQR